MLDSLRSAAAIARSYIDTPAKQQAVTKLGAQAVSFYLIAPLVVRRYWNRLGFGGEIDRRQARALIMLAHLAASTAAPALRSGMRDSDEIHEALTAIREAAKRDATVIAFGARAAR